MVTVAGLEDTVVVRRAEARDVRCRGLDEDLPPERNLAWRALDALAEEAGHDLPPLAVDIDKRIPARAGLGGGSSDAAATLRAADRLLGLGLGRARLERAAAAVGSDVPFLVAGGCQWARGRGEILAPAAAPRFHAVVLVPAAGLETARVYRAFDRLRAPARDERPVPADARGLAGWVRNDLWPAALGCAPAIASAARALAGRGARATLLCGSGAGVAGLFDDAAVAAAAAGDLAGTGRAVAAVSGPAPASLDTRRRAG
jgi:4-diphosphocytidyl-2-C-methyl-D-erythritol kinase